MNEISPIILHVVKNIKDILGAGSVVEILDEEMIQKYPNNYAKNGYWGVTISICVINHPRIPKHRIFLKYQTLNILIFLYK